MASKEMQSLIDVMRQVMGQGSTPAPDWGDDPLKMRDIMEASQARMPIAPGVVCTADTLGGVEAQCCTPDNAREDAVILYIHGGGSYLWQCPYVQGLRFHAGRSGQNTGIHVSYRLVPEHQYPAANDDCYDAYADVVKRHPNKPVFLIGESGGGYLSLTTTIKAKDTGLKLPAGIIAYSTPIDFSESIDRSANDGKDFMVPSPELKTLRAMFCPDPKFWKDPYFSPLYGDYTGFPPMLVVWDVDETLAADSEKLVEIAKAAGIQVQHKAYSGCFHAFPTAGHGTPESAEVLADTKAFIEKHIN
jgi:acetyl esterase/lipase